MSVPAPNFVLVSELQTLSRRDFPVADATVLPPANSNVLLDGEWVELNSTYQVARGAPGAGVHEGLTVSYPVHTERGRYDTQAINKVNVLFMGMYEAETVICDSAGPAVVGDMLSVVDINTQGFATRRGLKKVSATTGGFMVVGFVTKVIGTAGVAGKIRFVHFGYQKLI